MERGKEGGREVRGGGGTRGARRRERRAQSAVARREGVEMEWRGER